MLHGETQSERTSEIFFKSVAKGNQIQELKQKRIRNLRQGSQPILIIATRGLFSGFGLSVFFEVLQRGTIKKSLTCEREADLGAASSYKTASS